MSNPSSEPRLPEGMAYCKTHPHILKVEIRLEGHTYRLMPDEEQVRQYLTLTTQQRLCLEYAADGHTNPEIAELMGLAVQTVTQHLGEARQRLEARNTAHAVAIAIRHGLVL